MTTQSGNMPSIALLCAAMAIILAVGAIASGFGTRMGWWSFRTGLSLLRWSAYAELAIGAFALAGGILAAVRGGGSGLLLYLLAFVISIAPIIVPFRMYLVARAVPAIHDITTDTENPPPFDVILGLRKDALNPAEYGGPEIALQQKKTYPDIKPLLMDTAPVQTFERALSAARTMGWEIVNADPAEGRIEATDTTFWFGFKDDIVIRIAPDVTGSRIDVRSLSRVGRSDVGANADRIRRYLNSLKKGA